MDEREDRARKTAPDAEEPVRRLLEEAGPRDEVPGRELAAITGAARARWQELVERRRVRARWRRRAVALALAAGVAAGVGLALRWARPMPPAAAVGRLDAAFGGVRLDGSPDPAPGAEIVPGAVLETAGGGTIPAGRAALRLATGTVVRLDAGSRVRFASARRLELERGALYADTGDESVGRELEVATPLGTARDVGTRFMVRLSETAGLRVGVRDGRVALERPGGTLVAAAGREIVVRADGAAEERVLAGWDAAWQWVVQAAAPFAVDGRTLGELLDVAARETGWTIRFEPLSLETSARAIVLHGTTGNLPLDRAVLAVLPGAGLDGRLEDGVLTIRAPEP